MTDNFLLLLQLHPLGNVWGDYMKTLIVLLGICMLAVTVIKAVLPRLRGIATPTSSRIRVLASQPLEPRKTLYVVQAGDLAVLIATSGEAVHFMTRLEYTDFQDELTDDSKPTRSTSPFSKVAQFVSAQYQDEQI
jgi:flagellar biogenesis protein FliO